MPAISKPAETLSVLDAMAVIAGVVYGISKTTCQEEGNSEGIILN
jgi:hypothetical protein